MIGQEMKGAAPQEQEEMAAQAPQQPAQPVAQPDPAQTADVQDDMVTEDAEVEMGPAQEAQLEAYRDNATLAVFSEKTQPAILQILQSSQGNPTEALGRAAFMIHKRLESSMKDGEKMTEITMALGAAHLVSELVVLAEAAGLYSLEPEQRLEAFQQALKMYFEEGLNNGTIDPIELQKTMEPLMTPDQRKFGSQAMEQHGVSKTVPPKGLLGRTQR
jgi:hypothetical protein